MRLASTLWPGWLIHVSKEGRHACTPAPQPLPRPNPKSKRARREDTSRVVCCYGDGRYLRVPTTDIQVGEPCLAATHGHRLLSHILASLLPPPPHHTPTALRGKRGRHGRVFRHRHLRAHPHRRTGRRCVVRPQHWLPSQLQRALLRRRCRRGDELGPGCRRCGGGRRAGGGHRSRRERLAPA